MEEILHAIQLDSLEKEDFDIKKEEHVEELRADLFESEKMLYALAKERKYKVVRSKAWEPDEKWQEIIEQTAKDFNTDADAIFDLIQGYYTYIKEMIASPQLPRVLLPQLGIFYPLRYKAHIYFRKLGKIIDEMTEIHGSNPDWLGQRADLIYEIESMTDAYFRIEKEKMIQHENVAIQTFRFRQTLFENGKLDLTFFNPDGTWKNPENKAKQVLDHNLARIRAANSQIIREQDMIRAQKEYENI
jgi:hypothetical protein